MNGKSRSVDRFTFRTFKPRLMRETRIDTQGPIWHIGACSTSFRGHERFAWRRWNYDVITARKDATRALTTKSRQGGARKKTLNVNTWAGRLNLCKRGSRKQRIFVLAQGVHRSICLSQMLETLCFMLFASLSNLRAPTSSRRPFFCPLFAPYLFPFQAYFTYFVETTHKDYALTYRRLCRVRSGGSRRRVLANEFQVVLYNASTP